MPYAIFDTNFITQIYRVDPSCSLLDLISDYYHSECVFHEVEYNISSCNKRRNPPCTHIGTLQSDEDVLYFTMNHKEDISKIVMGKKERSNVPDVQFICLAVNNNGTIILSGDSSLLEACYKLSIPRDCFKSSLRKLDRAYEGAIFEHPEFHTREMNDPNGDHPYFHYSCSKRCPMCDPEKQCELNQTA